MSRSGDDIRKELREAQQRFRLAFDNAPIGMALVAPDGRWLEVNAAVCEIVGYPEAVMLTKTFQDITHPDDLDADLEYVRQMLAGEIRTYSMKKRYFHADGHEVWINLSVSLARDEDGTPLYFISQIQDITERQRLEEQRRHLEDARREFLAVAAHELRNPVTALSGILEILRERGVAGLGEDDARSALSAACRQTEHLRELVDDVLDLTQADLGSLSMSPVPLDVAALAAEVARDTPPPDGKSIELALRKTTAPADPLRLRQVITNLVANAYRHGGDHVSLEVRPDGDTALVAVSDDGPGVDMAFLPTMFEPFARGRTAAGGSGLGLAVVHRLMTAMGGAVGYRPVEPHGACFWVRLKNATE